MIGSVKNGSIKLFCSVGIDGSGKLLLRERGDNLMVSKPPAPAPPRRLLKRARPFDLSKYKVWPG